MLGFDDRPVARAQESKQIGLVDTGVVDKDAAAHDVEEHVGKVMCGRQFVG